MMITTASSDWLKMTTLLVSIVSIVLLMAIIHQWTYPFIEALGRSKGLLTLLSYVVDLLIASVVVAALHAGFARYAKA